GRQRRPDRPCAGNGRASPLAFSFRLTDRESDDVDVQILVVPPGGGPPFAAALVGSPSGAGLASSPSGTVHARQGDYPSQLASGSGLASGFRLQVVTAGAAATSESEVFSVGNDAPVLSGIVAPAGELTGLVRIDFTVADSSSDPVTVACEYEDAD